MPFLFEQHGTTLRHSSPRWSGCGLVLMGLAMSIGVTFGKCWESTGGWLAYLISGVFVVVGVLTILSTDELHLDLESRTYCHRSGLWMWAREAEGTFDEFKALAIDKKSSGRTPTWTVSLVWRHGASQRTLGAWFTEDEAYRGFEQLGRELGMPTLDRTGGTPCEYHAPRSVPPLRERFRLVTKPHADREEDGPSR